jgi:hypothetical protein
MVRFILIKLHLFRVQKELHKVLVTHLLVSVIQCSKMNARIIYTFSPDHYYVVKYNFYTSLLAIPCYYSL